jgi:hypothetical protein
MQYLYRTRLARTLGVTRLTETDQTVSGVSATIPATDAAVK